MILKNTFDRHKVAVAVGIYDTLVGLWPLCSMSSFSAVTGINEHFGIVRAIAIAWFGLGVALLLCRNNSKAITVLGCMSLFAGGTLSIVELVLIIQRQLSPIFFAQIVAESAIGLSWILSLGQGETVADLRSTEKSQLEKEFEYVGRDS